MSQVKLVAITPNIEKLACYIARVSNPANQHSESTALLDYCIKHQHWSVFEHGFITLEMNTTRAISAQLLRHRSFTFQEFSQRYAKVDMLEIEIPDLRLQDHTNRQNSIDAMDSIEKDALRYEIDGLFQQVDHVYSLLLNKGVAKECARMVLPMCAPTKVYMSGSLRSWIHYIELRSANCTQKEHMVLAEEAKKIISEQLPVVAKALKWI